MKTRKNIAPPARVKTLVEEAEALLGRGTTELNAIDSTIDGLENRLEQARVRRIQTQQIVDGLKATLQVGECE